ncbi:MAG: hypothetical protein R3C17_19145 [Planctomycetaceae bacterium]
MTESLGRAPMFRFESEMAPTVSQWLRAAGLRVKQEFMTPWGVCDFVALRFNSDRVDHRLNLRQTRSVGSLTQAILLLQVPDIDTRKATTVDKLVKRCVPVLAAKEVEREVSRLVAHRFLVQSRNGRLQKVNGWMPIQERLVTVELKLARVQEAMQQAKKNLDLGAESYVAFPSDVANRIAAKPQRWQRYFDVGIGLLAVSPSNCTQLIGARVTGATYDQAVQLHAVEKFWRTRLRDI